MEFEQEQNEHHIVKRNLFTINLPVNLPWVEFLDSLLGRIYQTGSIHMNTVCLLVCKKKKEKSLTKHKSKTHCLLFQKKKNEKQHMKELHFKLISELNKLNTTQ